MILSKLEINSPGVDWKKGMPARLGYNSAQYYIIYKGIERGVFGIPYPESLISNMHLSLELALKGIALKIDPNFDIKKYGHKTSKIIDDFKGKIPLFLTIYNTPEQFKLLLELEKGFVHVRYGDCVICIYESDRISYDYLFNLLIQFLSSETGLNFLNYMSESTINF